MIGDPDITTTDEIVKLALENQVDIVELGIPIQIPLLTARNASVYAAGIDFFK